MFTTLQKYQKAFLVFITVLLTAAFGLGGVCFTIFEPSNFQTIATIGQSNKKFSSSEFDIAKRYWRTMHRLSKKLSPKARASFEQLDKQNYQQYMGLMYRFINDRIELPLVWDHVYSLSEAVLKVDAKIDQQLESSQTQLNSSQMLQRRIDAYLNLSEGDRRELQKELSDSDTWKCLILLEEAKSLGLQVSNAEVNNTIQQTIKNLGGKENFNREIANSMLYSDFKTMVKNALLISKLIHTKASTIKVTSQEAYDVLKNDLVEYQADYVTITDKQFMAVNEYEYRQQRLKFFDEKQESDATFFQTTANANLEYVYASGNSSTQNITLSEQEVLEYVSFNADLYRDFEDQSLDDILALKREIIENNIKTDKAKSIAQEKLTNMRNSLASLKGLVHLSKLAQEYGLVYGQHFDISEDKYLDLENIGTAPAKKQVYEELKQNEFSRVLSGRNSGHFFVRLTNRIPSRKIAKEEIENNDQLFLQKFYENNKWKFTSNEKYRLAYIIADYDEISKTLEPTTNDLKQFYDTYKEQLYKTESGYKNFADVKNDIVERVGSLLKSRMLQKVHIVQKRCKALGEETNIGLVVRELGSRVGLKYHEQKELLTADEIKKENVVNDKNFAPSLTKDTKVSEVIDSEKGKYFYIVLESKDAGATDFENIKDEVKQKFLEEQALLKAKSFSQDLVTEYNVLLQKAKEKVEKAFVIQIENATDKDSVVAEKMLQVNQLNTQVLSSLALKYNLNYQTTPTFVNIADVPALKDSFSAESEIKKLQVGGISSPVEDANKKEVYLFLLTQKRSPELNEISQTELVQVQQGIWEQRYQKKLQNELLDYKKLAETMKFQISNEFETLNEDDLLNDEGF